MLGGAPRPLLNCLGMCLSFCFAFGPKPLPSSHQGRHSTIEPLGTLGVTMAWNGLRPHTMNLDLFDVALGLFLWLSSEVSFLFLTPASTPHSSTWHKLGRATEIHSLLLPQQQRHRWHGCLARDCSSKSFLQLSVARTELFAKG